jgi:hypothetical protein
MDTAETISNSNIGQNCNCPRVPLRRSYLMKKTNTLKNLVALSLYLQVVVK